MPGERHRRQSQMQITPVGCDGHQERLNRSAALATRAGSSMQGRKIAAKQVRILPDLIESASSFEPTGNGQNIRRRL